MTACEKTTEHQSRHSLPELAEVGCGSEAAGLDARPVAAFRPAGREASTFYLRNMRSGLRCRPPESKRNPTCQAAPRGVQSDLTSTRFLRDLQALLEVVAFSGLVVFPDNGS